MEEEEATHLGIDPSGYKKSLFRKHSKMKTVTIRTLAELESEGSGLHFEVLGTFLMFLMIA